MELWTILWLFVWKMHENKEQNALWLLRYGGASEFMPVQTQAPLLPPGVKVQWFLISYLCYRSCRCTHPPRRYPEVHTHSHWSHQHHQCRMTSVAAHLLLSGSYPLPAVECLDTHTSLPTQIIQQDITTKLIEAVRRTVHVLPVCYGLLPPSNGVPWHSYFTPCTQISTWNKITTRMIEALRQPVLPIRSDQVVTTSQQGVPWHSYFTPCNIFISFIDWAFSYSALSSCELLVLHIRINNSGYATWVTLESR
jgi:hypothetical protein